MYYVKVIRENKKEYYLGNGCLLFFISLGLMFFLLCLFDKFGWEFLNGCLFFEEGDKIGKGGVLGVFLWGVKICFFVIFFLRKGGFIICGVLGWFLGFFFNWFFWDNWILIFGVGLGVRGG